MVLDNGDIEIVPGWESSLVLGILKEEDETFSSIMLMSGRRLWTAFETVDQAHEFNLAVLRHNRLFPGTPDINEFFERAGSRARALEYVSDVARRVLKRKEQAA
jgi:hypothetical protein